ncbi:hypothetical protein LAV72_18655 [Lysinibacillus xylanilyticus]|uniref:hypothetical protein n=1 Tax=Lysinibacillus TaxID=400634 RepID=UPI002B254F3D|nr:hypothetical protein [Lysinibacillus xylanilyticus]MEB2301628.1 hypothetical protein [Lysinibacillus xylanilyticus]
MSKLIEHDYIALNAYLRALVPSVRVYQQDALNSFGYTKYRIILNSDRRYVNEKDIENLLYQEIQRFFSNYQYRLNWAINKKYFWITGRRE